jgi:two-component system response regulator NreC
MRALAKTRIMLVDDHKVLRSGLRALINQQLDLEVVAEAATVREASSKASQCELDVVLLDVTLPEGGSIEFIAELVAKGSLPRILVLSTHNDPAYARAALGAGASGYLVKSISEEDLLAAIRTVSRGKVVVDLDDENLNSKVFGLGASASVRGPLHSLAGLSEREREVLRLIGQGYSNLEVAEKLDISPKTVATYRARIGEKLGLKSTADYVRFVANTGSACNPAPQT